MAAGAPRPSYPPQPTGDLATRDSSTGETVRAFVVILSAGCGLYLEPAQLNEESLILFLI